MHCGITVDTEIAGQKISWGVAQILGKTARALGFKKMLSQLLNVETGLFYACQLIKELQRAYTSQDDVISAYNQGQKKTLKHLNGKYLNQDYVDKVHLALKRAS